MTAPELGLGLGTAEQGAERGWHGQARLPDKIFLLELGCRECVGAGQLVRRGQGRLDSVSSTIGWGDGLHMSGEEERGEGNPEDTPRALS